MFRAFLDACGRLDILVANSGIQQDAPVAEMTAAQWRRVLDVNLTGQFLSAREAVRIFLAQGAASGLPSRAAGKIVCMSSVHDVIPWAGHVNYAASKGGVSLLMRSLAQELAEKRIRVNAVSLGAIRTRTAPIRLPNRRQPRDGSSWHLRGGVVLPCETWRRCSARTTSSPPKW